MGHKANTHAAGGWYIVAAAFLWGTTGTAQTIAPPSAQPLTVGTMRLLIGAFALLLLAAYRGELDSVRRWRNWPPRATLLAALSIAAYQVFFFAGVARTGVAVGTVVGIGSTPVAAGILGYVAWRERPSGRWYLATGLAIAGCALMILAGNQVLIDPLGILLAVGAGTAYALYTLLGKELLGSKPAGAVLTVTFALGVTVLLPVLALGDLSWLLQPRGLAVALHLGVVTVGVAYLLFAIGLSSVNVATAATLTLAEPLTASLLGILVVGEQLNAVSAAGILLIFSGLLVLAARPAVVASSHLSDPALLTGLEPIQPPGYRDGTNPP